MMRKSLLWVAMVAFAQTGCGEALPGDHDSELPSVGSEEQGIINGSLDQTHQAVVAYLHGSKCTATIVHVAGNVGYALTAGHCINNNLGKLYQGDNHNNPTKTYNVTEVQRHPYYSGSQSNQNDGKSGLFDVAMIKFSGATASTPVIPVLPPAQDNIKAGSSFDLIGYGNTENGGTSKRHHRIQKTASVSALRLVWNQSAGGVCSGDSGGPAVYSSNGSEHVGGVHSYVTNSNCNEQGVSIRASAVYDSFILPFINGGSFQGESCDECSEAHTTHSGGDCVAPVVDCQNSSACNSYINCASQCSTFTCVNQCKSMHQAGADLYEAIDACVCTKPCSSECGGEPRCQQPACGLTSSNDSCQSCYEASCCAEAQACAGSAKCIDCITKLVPPADCDSDSTTQNLQACLATNCASECNVNMGTSSSSAGNTTATNGAGGGDPGAAGVGGASVGVGAGGSDSSAEAATNGAGGNNQGSVIVQSGCALSKSQPAKPSQDRRTAWWLACALGLALRRLRAAAACK